MDLEQEFLKRNPVGCLNLFKTLPDTDKEKYFLFIRVNKTINQMVLDELIENLPGEIRLKYLNLYGFGPFIHDKILEGVSEDYQYKIIKYFFDNQKDKVFVTSMFQRCPEPYKEDFLRYLFEYEKANNTKLLNSFEIKTIFMEFDYSSRIHILKDLLLPNLSDRISGSSEFNLLKCFEPSQNNNEENLLLPAFEILLEYDKSKNESFINFYSRDILELFISNGYDPIIIIKKILDGVTNINISSLTEIPQVVEIDKRLPIVEFLLDYFADNNKPISSFSFVSLVYSLDEDNIYKVFEKYIVTNKRINYLKLFDNKYALRTLQYLIKILPEDELKSNMGNLLAHFTYKEDYLDYSEEYTPIIDYFSEFYNLNKENLTEFIKRFGFISIKYINSPTISSYINLPKEEFSKFLELFRDENLFFDENNRNDVLNSLLQRKFMIDNKDIYNIFSLFETFVRHNDYPNIMLFLEVIEKTIDVQKILLQNSITREELIDQIKNGNLNVLHKITDRFIAFKREQYTAQSTKDGLQMLKLDKVMSRSSYKKYIVEKKDFYIHPALLNMKDYNFTPEQKYLIENQDVLSRLIEFKKNPKEVSLSIEDKKYLRVFSELLDIMYDQKKYLIKIDGEIDPKFAQYDFVLVQKPLFNNGLISIMMETNFDGLISIIKNRELFEKLQSYLAKYKMLGWDDTYTELMSKCDIVCDESTLGSLISNFDKLVEKIESRDDTLTATIDRANCYSSSSKLYSLLFGNEDYSLIAANSGKNKSPLLKHERISKDVELIPKMYQRTSVTVPPINKTFTLANNKKLSVNLGNVTNMMNLTYGERTEACMRQGGAFDGLFKYCILNNNGFHVRITNPNTGEFVSRVSGFRNGNTIFLNELRESVVEDYSREDLYEVIKQVANFIIEKSKDSAMPIDNVLITSDYALEDQRKYEIDLQLSKEDKAAAFKGIPVNYVNEGILLASSDNGNLVPYHFSENVPEYPVLRDKVKVYRGTEAINRILQIKLINSVINSGEASMDLVDEEVEYPEYVISGEDFYIAKYAEYTDTFIMDFAKENDKTQSEIATVLNNLEEYLQSKGSERND